MIDFCCIHMAVKSDFGAGLFWRLLLGTVVMLAIGCVCEQSSIYPCVGFTVGMAEWAVILYETFVGEG